MNSRSLICAAMLVGSLFAAGATAAQPAANGTEIQEARLRWADRHEQLVCSPLQDRGEIRRARQCFDRVAAVRQEARSTGEATASLPANAVTTEGSALLPPSRPRSARCTGVECIKLFGSLGVAF